MKRTSLWITALLTLAIFAPVSSATAAFVKPPRKPDFLSSATLPAPAVTMEFVMKHTYINNPTLKAARANVRAGDEDIVQAMSGWRPNISADADITAARYRAKSNIDAPGMGNYDNVAKTVGLNVVQPLYRGGRTDASIRAAENRVKANRSQLLKIEQDVLLQAVIAYMDVSRDMSVLKLNEANENVIRRQLRAAKARFSVGEITRTDVSQSESRLARAISERIAAEGALKTSRAVYEQVIGLPVSGELSSAQIDLSLPESLEAALSILPDNSPMIHVAKYTESAAKDDVNVALGSLYPELNLNGNLAKAYDPGSGFNDETGSASIGVSASIPLYQSGSARSKIRQAKIIANQRRIEVLEQELSVKQSMISSWENWQSARAEIESRQSQVRAAQIARDGVYHELKVGSRTTLDALDADQELLDSRVSLKISQRNEIVSKYSFAAAMGLLTPSTLGFFDVAYKPELNTDNVKQDLFGLQAALDIIK